MPYPKQWNFLKKTVEVGKVPQALLFSGHDLEGIREVALEFVKLINGRESVKGVHPDLFLVEPQDQKEIKIQQIRELRSRLSFSSYSALFKTVIIDRAHLLNQDAQSAFLKLLEEPKGQTLFIFITNYPDLLLDTILSRVEHLRFYSALPPFSSLQKEMIGELLKAKKGDLNFRFRYAKKLAEDPQNLGEILETWLRHFREILLSDPHNPQTFRIIKTAQNIHSLLSATNANPRLALEVLMLEL